VIDKDYCLGKCWAPPPPLAWELAQGLEWHMKVHPTHYALSFGPFVRDMEQPRGQHVLLTEVSYVKVNVLVNTKIWNITFTLYFQNKLNQYSLRFHIKIKISHNLTQSWASNNPNSTTLNNSTHSLTPTFSVLNKVTYNI